MKLSKALHFPNKSEVIASLPRHYSKTSITSKDINAAFGPDCTPLKKVLATHLVGETFTGITGGPPWDNIDEDTGKKESMDYQSRRQEIEQYTLVGFVDNGKKLVLYKKGSDTAFVATEVHGLYKSKAGVVFIFVRRKSLKSSSRRRSSRKRSSRRRSSRGRSSGFRS